MAVGIHIAAVALIFALAFFVAVKIIEPNNTRNKLTTAVVIGALLAGAGYMGLFYTWFLLVPLGYALIYHYDLGLVATIGLLVGLGFLATISAEAVEVSFDWLATQGIDIPRLET